jgi:superfamily I DNA/RNA helicase
MRLPTWDELLDEQRDVLDHPLDQPLFVAGPPGSGKTVLAIGRARMLAEGTRDVTIVTFNRMLRRLTTLLYESQQIAATMHSYVWRDYMRLTGAKPIMLASDRYAFDWTAMTAALEVSTSSTSNQHLIIDEAQDLAEGFFRYAGRRMGGALTVFADDDQALRPKRTTLDQIKAAASLPNPVILQDNHRNTPEIAAVAEHFHSGRLPAARVRRPRMLQRPLLVHERRLADATARIARWFETRGGTVGVVVWSNDTGDLVHRELRKLLSGRRVDFYTSNRKNEDSISLLDAGITVVNTESVKGQEFDTLFLLELERFVPCNVDHERRVMYMLCARARDYLFLVHLTELSAAASDSLPPDSLLERA